MAASATARQAITYAQTTLPFTGLSFPDRRRGQPIG
jgi:hypothetical protein